MHTHLEQWAAWAADIAAPGEQFPGGSVPCSRVSPQSWTLPARAGIRTHNLGLPRVSSPTLYPLGHDCPINCLHKSKKLRGPQCLLQCPVLNGKDRRRKLFIIQMLKGVKCLKRRRGTDRLIPLCLSPSILCVYDSCQPSRTPTASQVIHIPSLQPERGMEREERMLDGEKWRMKKGDDTFVVHWCYIFLIH